MEKEKIVKKMDNVVEKFSWPIYFYTIAGLHIAYFLLFFGFLSINKEYINVVNIFIQVFVCAFLMYRFNPLRKPELHKNDGPIIFASALFLLTNLGFTQYIYYYAKIVIDKNAFVIEAINKIISYFGYAPIQINQTKPPAITQQKQQQNNNKKNDINTPAEYILTSQ